MRRAMCWLEPLEDRRLLAGDPFGWQAIEPLGSLVYQAQASGAITTGEQRDEFTLEIDPGQKFALLVEPSPALHVAVELLNAEGQQLATGVASGAGELLRLSAPAAAEPGQYRLVISSVEASLGEYSARFFVGAELELELAGGATNDTANDAEVVDGYFESLGQSAAAHAAVVGEGGEDWYRFSLADGQAVSVTLGSAAAANAEFEIYDAQQQLLAVSALENQTFHVVRDFVDSTSDGAANEYLIRVVGEAGQYSLAVLRDSGIEQEPNGGSPAGAEQRDGDGRWLGFVGPWTQPWREAELLLPADAMTNDQTGETIAVDGDWMLIGSPGASDGAGSARVYRRAGDRWVFEQSLAAPDAARQDAFGTGVAIHGELAVVGAQLEDEAGQSAGAAYVFRFDGSQWLFEEKLLAADGASNDRFGSSVGVAGELIVVGAPLDDDRSIGVDIGAVYQFQFDGTSWQPAGKLQAVDPNQFDHFGTSVAIRDDLLLIGAEEDDDAALNGGSVYVYRRLEELWEFEQKLISEVITRDSHFGHSLALDGQTAIIGAPGNDGTTDDSGAAYIFRFDGTVWNEEQVLLAADSAELDSFGESVAILANRAFIGAPQHDPLFNDSGAAYSFTFDGSVWTLEQKLIPLDASADARFGSAVAVQGETLVVGAAGRLLEPAIDPEMPSVSTGGVYTFAETGIAVDAANGPLEQTAFDLFSFSANAGDVLQISTHTPSAGAGDALNRLVPTLELLDPAGRLLVRNIGGASDGRNARLEFEVTQPGEYTIRVGAAGDTGGEYLLELNGATAAGPGFEFAPQESFPAPGQNLQSARQLLIAFEESLLLSTLSAADLLVDGEPATDVQIIDGKRAVFELAANLADGRHSIEFAAATLANVSGSLNRAFQYDFFVDSIAPRITAISLTPDFVLETGVFEFTMTLSQANPIVDFDLSGNPIYSPSLVIDRGGLQLVGQKSGTYDVRSLTLLSINAQQTTLRFTFRDLQIDDYTLTIVGGLDGVRDLAGNPLDGEVEMLPIPPGGSGDGVPGGNFVYSFSVMADGPIAEISNVAGDPGERVTATIFLRNLNNVSAFDFDLAFDRELVEVRSARLGSAAANWTLAARIDNSTGTLTGSLFNFNLVTGAGGAFLEVDFEISPDAPLGSESILDLARVSINEAAFPALVTDGLLSVKLPAFRVISAFADASLVDLEFDRAIDPATLRLYGEMATPASVATLTNSASDNIPGSLIWQAGENRLSFVPTGGLLPADDYQLTVRSGATGIGGGNGEILDGDDDGLAGGDYMLDFSIEALEARTVAIADFSRGPRQPIQLAGTAGLPIRIDEGEAAQKVELTIRYDPSLLDVSGAAAGAGLPADWQVTHFEMPSDGELQITIEGTTPLASGGHKLLSLSATVPAAATVGSSHLLRLESVRINDGAIAARGDSGVHLAAFVGDSNNNGQYSHDDALEVARIAIGQASGFPAFPAIDPIIVADVTGDGSLSSYDSAFIARKGLDLEQPEIPDLPSDEMPMSELVLPAPPISGAAGSTVAFSLLSRPTDAAMASELGPSDLASEPNERRTIYEFETVGPQKSRETPWIDLRQLDAATQAKTTAPVHQATQRDNEAAADDWSQAVDGTILADNWQEDAP